MRWPWRRQPVLDAPTPEPEPLPTEPERGTFDFPHRIRSREQMEADDARLPISAAGFIAYTEKRAQESQARADCDLSIWECVPDPDPEENYVHHAHREPEPVVVAGNVTRTQRVVERLLDRLRR